MSEQNGSPQDPLNPRRRKRPLVVNPSQMSASAVPSATERFLQNMQMLGGGSPEASMPMETEVPSEEPMVETETVDPNQQQEIRSPRRPSPPPPKPSPTPSTGGGFFGLRIPTEAESAPAPTPTPTPRRPPVRRPPTVAQQPQGVQPPTPSQPVAQRPSLAPAPPPSPRVAPPRAATPSPTPVPRATPSPTPVPSPTPQMTPIPGLETAPQPPTPQPVEFDVTDAEGNGYVIDPDQRDVPKGTQRYVLYRGPESLTPAGSTVEVAPDGSTREAMGPGGGERFLAMDGMLVSESAYRDEQMMKRQARDLSRADARLDAAPVKPINPNQFTDSTFVYNANNAQSQGIYRRLSPKAKANWRSITTDQLQEIPWLRDIVQKKKGVKTSAYKGRNIDPGFDTENNLAAVQMEAAVLDRDDRMALSMHYNGYFGVRPEDIRKFNIRTADEGQLRQLRATLRTRLVEQARKELRAGRTLSPSVVKGLQSFGLSENDPRLVSASNVGRAERRKIEAITSNMATEAEQPVAPGTKFTPLDPRQFAGLPEEQRQRAIRTAAEIGQLGITTPEQADVLARATQPERNKRFLEEVLKPRKLSDKQWNDLTPEQKGQMMGQETNEWLDSWDAWAEGTPVDSEVVRKARELVNTAVQTGWTTYEGIAQSGMAWKNSVFAPAFRILADVQAKGPGPVRQVLQDLGFTKSEFTRKYLTPNRIAEGYLSVRGERDNNNVAAVVGTVSYLAADIPRFVVIAGLINRVPLLGPLVAKYQLANSAGTFAIDLGLQAFGRGQDAEGVAKEVTHGAAMGSVMWLGGRLASGLMGSLVKRSAKITPGGNMDALHKAMIASMTQKAGVKLPPNASREQIEKATRKALEDRFKKQLSPEDINTILKIKGATDRQKAQALLIRALGVGTEVGVIGGGIYAVDRLMGKDEDAAAMAAINMVGIHFGMKAFSGIIYRRKDKDYIVDPDGTVRRLDKQVDDDLVDFNLEGDLVPDNSPLPTTAVRWVNGQRQEGRIIYEGRKPVRVEFGEGENKRVGPVEKDWVVVDGDQIRPQMVWRMKDNRRQKGILTGTKENPIVEVTRGDGTSFQTPFTEGGWSTRKPADRRRVRERVFTDENPDGTLPLTGKQKGKDTESPEATALNTEQQTLAGEIRTKTQELAAARERVAQNQARPGDDALIPRLEQEIDTANKRVAEIDTALTAIEKKAPADAGEAPRDGAATIDLLIREYNGLIRNGSDDVFSTQRRKDLAERIRQLRDANQKNGGLPEELSPERINSIKPEKLKEWEQSGYDPKKATELFGVKETKAPTEQTVSAEVEAIIAEAKAAVGAKAMPRNQKNIPLSEWQRWKESGFDPAQRPVGPKTAPAPKKTGTGRVAGEEQPREVSERAKELLEERKQANQDLDAALKERDGAKTAAEKATAEAKVKDAEARLQEADRQLSTSGIDVPGLIAERNTTAKRLAKAKKELEEGKETADAKEQERLTNYAASLEKDLARIDGQLQTLGFDPANLPKKPTRVVAKPTNEKVVDETVDRSLDSLIQSGKLNPRDKKAVAEAVEGIWAKQEGRAPTKGKGAKSDPLNTKIKETTNRLNERWKNRETPEEFEARIRREAPDKEAADKAIEEYRAKRAAEEKAAEAQRKKAEREQRKAEREGRTEEEKARDAEKKRQEDLATVNRLIKEKQQEKANLEGTLDAERRKGIRAATKQKIGKIDKLIAKAEARKAELEKALAGDQLTPAQRKAANTELVGVKERIAGYQRQKQALELRAESETGRANTAKTKAKLAEVNKALDGLNRRKAELEGAATPKAEAPKPPKPLTKAEIKKIAALTKKGVKPAAIAKQLGLDPALVKQAVADIKKAAPKPLTKTQIKQIAALTKKGVKPAAIAKQLGLDPALVKEAVATIKKAQQDALEARRKKAEEKRKQKEEQKRKEEEERKRKEEEEQKKKEEEEQAETKEEGETLGLPKPGDGGEATAPATGRKRGQKAKDQAEKEVQERVAELRKTIADDEAYIKEKQDKLDRALGLDKATREATERQIRQRQARVDAAKKELAELLPKEPLSQDVQSQIARARAEKKLTDKEIAEKYGTTEEVVQSISPAEAVGDFGQASYQFRKNIEDSNTLGTKLYDLFRKLLGKDLPEEWSAGAVDAILDRIAKSVGRNRSSEMTRADWLGFTKKNWKGLGAEGRRVVLDAITRQESWNRTWSDLARNAEAIEIINRARATGKKTWAELSPADKKRLTEIGDSYGKRAEEGFIKISRKALEKAVSAELSGGVRASWKGTVPSKTGAAAVAPAKGKGKKGAKSAGEETQGPLLARTTDSKGRTQVTDSRYTTPIVTALRVTADTLRRIKDYVANGLFGKTSAKAVAKAYVSDLKTIQKALDKLKDLSPSELAGKMTFTVKDGHIFLSPETAAFLNKLDGGDNFAGAYLPRGAAQRILILLDKSIDDLADAGNVVGSRKAAELYEAFVKQIDSPYGDVVAVVGTVKTKTSNRITLQEERGHQADQRLTGTSKGPSSIVDSPEFKKAAEKIKREQGYSDEAAYAEVIAKSFKETAEYELGLTAKEVASLQTKYAKVLADQGLTSTQVREAFQGVDTPTAREFVQKYDSIRKRAYAKSDGPYGPEAARINPVGTGTGRGQGQSAYEQLVAGAPSGGRRVPGRQDKVNVRRPGEKVISVAEDIDRGIMRVERDGRQYLRPGNNPEVPLTKKERQLLDNALPKDRPLLEDMIYLARLPQTPGVKMSDTWRRAFSAANEMQRTASSKVFTGAIPGSIGAAVEGANFQKAMMSSGDPSLTGRQAFLLALATEGQRIKTLTEVGLQKVMKGLPITAADVVNKRIRTFTSWTTSKQRRAARTWVKEIEELQMQNNFLKPDKKAQKALEKAEKALDKKLGNKKITELTDAERKQVERVAQKREEMQNANAQYEANLNRIDALQRKLRGVRPNVPARAFTTLFSKRGVQDLIDLTENNPNRQVAQEAGLAVAQQPRVNDIVSDGSRTGFVSLREVTREIDGQKRTGNVPIVALDAPMEVGDSVRLVSNGNIKGKVIVENGDLAVEYTNPKTKQKETLPIEEATKWRVGDPVYLKGDMQTRGVVTQRPNGEIVIELVTDIPKGPKGQGIVGGLKQRAANLAERGRQAWSGETLSFGAKRTGQFDADMTQWTTDRPMTKDWLSLYSHDSQTASAEYFAGRAFGHAPMTFLEPSYLSTKTLLQTGQYGEVLRKNLEALRKGLPPHQLIHRSGRSMDAVMSYMRMQAFDGYAQDWMTRHILSGKTLDDLAEMKKDLEWTAYGINAWSGTVKFEGSVAGVNIGELAEKAVPALNTTTFFSTRLLGSRFYSAFILPARYGPLGDAPKYVKRQFSVGLARQLSAFGALLGLGITLGGAEVMFDDPTDAAFLRLKFGDLMSVDLSAGTTAAIVFGARALDATGAIELAPPEDLEGDEDPNPLRALTSISANFFKKKLHPGPQKMIASILGKDVLGRPTSWQEQYLDPLAWGPLTFQNFVNNYKDAQLLTQRYPGDYNYAILAPLIEGTGFGTSIIPDAERQAILKEADLKEFSERWGYSPDSDEYLDREEMWDNKIEYAERAATLKEEAQINPQSKRGWKNIFRNWQEILRRGSEELEELPNIDEDQLPSSEYDLFIEMRDFELRQGVPIEEFERRWRENVGEIPKKP